jgi:hypothetical protein
MKNVMAKEDRKSVAGIEEGFGVEVREEIASHAEIEEPILFWIAILAVGIILRIIVYDTTALAGTGPIYGLAGSISEFILFVPGPIILPLIIGAVIGSKVGVMSTNMKKAIKSGILNSTYAAVIYVVAIIVIYEVLEYTVPSKSIGVPFLIYGLVILPVLILLLVSVIFAVLSYSRRIS